MTTPLDICNRAFRGLGVLAGGETASADMQNDAFDLLNDIIDQWSNSTMMIPYLTEIVFPLQDNVGTYTIGPGGSIGATFTGSIATDVLTVTSIASGNIALGMTISGSGITAGTRILSFAGGAGEDGTYTVTPNQTAVSTTISAYYPRPLMIMPSTFVRVSTLDYPVIPINAQQYSLIGIKNLQGPWPRTVYYQPTDPLGNIIFWPLPQQGAEMHLFVQTVLQRYASLQDDIVLPQGYLLALRWTLAEQLMPEYPATSTASEIRALVPKYAAEGRAWIKRMNMQPPIQAEYPDVLTGRYYTSNSSWIYSGGFLN
jgi:hypothetical protein